MNGLAFNDTYSLLLINTGTALPSRPKQTSPLFALLPPPHVTRYSLCRQSTLQTMDTDSLQQQRLQKLKILEEQKRKQKNAKLGEFDVRLGWIDVSCGRERHAHD